MLSVQCEPVSEALEVATCTPHADATPRLKPVGPDKASQGHQHAVDAMESFD
jgi:hypothetical protein